MGRKAKLVRQGGRGAERFCHRITVYFSISRDIQEEDAEIIFCIFSIRGRGQSHAKLQSRICGAGRVELENVSRLNQVIHTVRDEAKHLSNDCCGGHEEDERQQRCIVSTTTLCLFSLWARSNSRLLPFLWTFASGRNLPHAHTRRTAPLPGSDRVVALDVVMDFYGADLI